jgi:hypothetical protein
MIVLPILTKQECFLEILRLVPEIKTEKVLAVTLWTDKKELERDEKEWYPRVEQILKPYLTNPSARKLYTLETSLCENFEKILIA